MKRILIIPFLILLAVLSGCFEIVQESNINDDGSGVFSNKTDLSSMLGMVSMLGGDEAKKMEKETKDTTISLGSFKDSLSNLGDREKQLLDKASLNIVLNVPDEKFFLAFNFPFTAPSDIKLINGLLKKTKQKVISQELTSMVPGDSSNTNSMSMLDGNEPAAPELDEYFDVITEQGMLVKKLNKEKYANAANDKDLKTLQEMSQLGTPFTVKTVFNLPRPVKKAEGKNIKLSSDKKQVTIEATIDDFFDDPSKFEYLIEY